ncbi:hypothetical protein FOA52_007861 [Chlamydomonas sp. UWO 241]|nr:hypothetical protein FOA52_007861 [Chlamydomonas sp. UWO 241]
MAAAGRVAAAMQAVKGPKMVDDEIEQRQDFDGLDAGDAGQAQRIVRELYFRYEKQLQRWRDYRTLFCFLFFVGWYLATLYLERSANMAFMVHSTLDDVLVPTTKVMQSTSQVHDWLSSTLDDVQNLTSIQIDLKWNFGHPLGSTPAAELMNNALWQLCPFNTPFTSACYYSADQTFTQLSGSVSMAILDAPDGVWTLDVKNDYFRKIGGAVRATDIVNNAAYYVKVYIAGASVLAEMDLEERLLAGAIQYGNTTLFSYIAWSLAQPPPRSGLIRREYEPAVAVELGVGESPTPSDGHFATSRASRRCIGSAWSRSFADAAWGGPFAASAAPTLAAGFYI